MFKEPTVSVVIPSVILKPTKIVIIRDAIKEIFLKAIHNKLPTRIILNIEAFKAPFVTELNSSWSRI